MATADCDLCCSGRSCSEYAESQSWDWANCEWNGNGACNGRGTPTYDCDFLLRRGQRQRDPEHRRRRPNFDGFGYPAGDKTSYPAGGWPYFYTAINDDCDAWQYQNSFISPTQFIEDHHF